MQTYKQRVAWLVTSMGYGDSIMYWEPILRKYTSTFPETRVYTSGKKTLDKADIHLEDAIKIYRLFVRKQKNTYQKNILLISPSVIFKVIKYKPDLMVLSEFGLLTIYGLLSRLLMPKTKVLLLVESNPHILAGSITRIPRQWIRSIICKAATHILTNNEAGKNYLKNELKVNDDKITTKSYLVSETTVDSSDNNDTLDLEHQKNKFISFLYTGQINHRKGVFDIIDAIKLLPKETIERCQIWIVGDGDYLTELKQIASKHNLEKYIRFFGKQPYTLMGNFYNNADVYLFPTRHDYRALVGFEALSYGLPLIHSRGDGAVSEVVIDNQNGFSFAPGDAKSMSNHMAFFINNLDKLELFGLQSKRLSETFTVENSAKSLVNASLNTLGVRQSL